MSVPLFAGGTAAPESVGSRQPVALPVCGVPPANLPGMLCLDSIPRGGPLEMPALPAGQAAAGVGGDATCVGRHSIPKGVLEEGPSSPAGQAPLGAGSCAVGLCSGAIAAGG
eukprot:10962667-Heterocapsa_arctica.AAC.1